MSIGSGRRRAGVLLVGYDARHVTPIGRGKNSGETLTESNIVRNFTSMGGTGRCPLTLHTNAIPGEHLAVPLESSDGAIVGAARVTDRQQATAR